MVHHRAMNVLVEATVVGAMLAPALAWTMYQFKPQTTTAVLIPGFVLGFAFHLICEITGLNRMYCAHGAACQR